MDSHEEIPELLSLKSVCRKLDLHPNTLRNWEKKGLIQCIRIGIKENRRYKKRDIVRLLKPRCYEERMKRYQKNERLKQVKKSWDKWREKTSNLSAVNQF